MFAIIILKMIFGRMQVGLFAEQFAATLHRRSAHSQHYEYHRQHHQTGQDLGGVCKHRGQIAGGESGVAGRNDHIGAQPGNGNNAGIHRQIHKGTVERHNLFCLGKILVDRIRNLGKLADLCVFPDKGFDNLCNY